MAYKNCNTYTEAKDELERMVKVNQKLSIEKSELVERIAGLEKELEEVARSKRQLHHPMENLR
jgi:regulator of replication initiation timing